MKKVLVTGATGFIGKALVKRLRKESCQVFEFKSNVLNPRNFLKFKKIDTVFHLAGIVGYANAKKNIALAYKTNITGTLNVLEFCRRQKSKLVFPSTFVYGPPFDKIKKETDRAQPTNFYTHSKYLAELFCQAYAGKYGLNIVIARASNAYGPNQPKQYIIPFLKDGEVSLPFLLSPCLLFFSVGL